MSRLSVLPGIVLALLALVHVIRPLYGEGILASLITFAVVLLLWTAGRRTNWFRRTRPAAVRASYAVGLLLVASLGVPGAQAEPDVVAAWYNPADWGETTWRTIGTVATLGAACGFAVVTLGAGTPACVGAAALTAGANVAWDVGVACISSECQNSEIGQSFTNFADGNIHAGFDHLISTPAPAVGNAVGKVHDGQNLDFLDYVGIAADTVPVTKAGKVVDLAASTTRSATHATDAAVAAARVADTSSAARIAVDPARYASQSFDYAQKAVRAAEKGRPAAALDLARKAEAAAAQSSNAARLLREANPSILERAVRKTPVLGRAEKAAKARQLGAAQQAADQAMKAARAAHDTAAASEAARIAKVAAKDAKTAAKAAKTAVRAGDSADVLRAAREAATEAANRALRAGKSVTRQADDVADLLRGAKPSVKGARLPPFNRTALWIKAGGSLDNGITTPDCSDLACLPTPDSDPDSPWMRLIKKREAYCLGERGPEFAGWDPRICDERVTDLLDCLMTSSYQNPFSDPACTALAGPWVYDALCTASDYEFCPEQSQTTDPGGLNPGPWGTIDACAELLPRELCEWVLVEGGDPAKALLDLFFDSMRPVITLSQPPQGTGSTNGGQGYLVPVLVTHGGAGLSCSSGDASELARMLGYCYEDYVIQNIQVDLEYNDDLVNSMDADRQDLATMGVLDPSSEDVAFKLPAILPHNDHGTLDVHVVVAYQLVRAYADGRPPILDPSAGYFTVEQRKQWNVDTSEAPTGGGGAGGSDPQPDPDPDPCQGMGCGEYWDDTFGGVGFSALLNWKFLLAIAAGLALLIAYRRGKLYKWLKVGPKPKSPLELYRKPGLMERLRRHLTGRAAPPRLKPEFQANGVPVVVPPNPDGTGPDPKALRDLLDGES